MPKFKQGNMLEHLDQCDYAFFTANAVVKHDNRLVMGAGIAKQVKELFKDIDLDLGEQIGKSRYGFCSTYLIKQSKNYPKIWAFQTKKHFRNNSDLNLIKGSVNQLKAFANSNPDKTIYLNFPGIGYGGLKREEVLPLIEILPDNCFIWERK